MGGVQPVWVAPLVVSHREPAGGRALDSQGFESERDLGPCSLRVSHPVILEGVNQAALLELVSRGEDSH